MTISAQSKNVLIEIFETLAHFPNLLMTMKSGEYTVDAHSLIGVLSIDLSQPIELILNNEPDENFINAVSKFVPSHA